MNLSTKNLNTIKKCFQTSSHHQNGILLQAQQKLLSSQSFSKMNRRSTRDTFSPNPDSQKKHYFKDQQTKIQDNHNELNMKLLNTIRDNKKQIHKLRQERDYYLNELKITNNKYLLLQNIYCHLKQIHQNYKLFLEQNNIKQIVLTPNSQTKQQLCFDQLCINNFLSLQRNQNQIEVSMVEKQNLKLKQQIKLLQIQLTKYETEKQKKTLDNITSESLILPIQKSIREIDLENKVSQLQKYIYDIESKHRNLKDRCKTIKHLIGKEN